MSKHTDVQKGKELEPEQEDMAATATATATVPQTVPPTAAPPMHGSEAEAEAEAGGRGAGDGDGDDVSMGLQLGASVMWQKLLAAGSGSASAGDGSKSRSYYWQVVVRLTAAQVAQLKRDVDGRPSGTHAVYALHTALRARLYVEACTADGWPCNRDGTPALVRWVVERDKLSAVMKEPGLHSTDLVLYIVRSSVPCSDRRSPEHAKDKDALRLRLVAYFVHAAGTVNGTVSKPFVMHMKQALPAALRAARTKSGSGTGTATDTDTGAGAGKSASASRFRWCELLKLAHEAHATACAKRRSCLVEVKALFSTIAESDEVAVTDAEDDAHDGDVCMTQNEDGRGGNRKLMTFLDNVRAKLLAATNAVAAADAALKMLQDMAQAAHVCYAAPHTDTVCSQAQSAAFFAKLVCSTRMVLGTVCRAALKECAHFTTALPDSLPPLAPQYIGSSGYGSAAVAVAAPLTAPVQTQTAPQKTVVLRHVPLRHAPMAVAKPALALAPAAAAAAAATT